MRIDIVSDVVCPWCIIGYKQLEHALEETGVSADIHWHPFQLNPHISNDGENLREHLAAKYGTSVEDSIKSRANLTAMGEELGFTFNYSDDMKTYNTFLAHQLLRWANEQDREHDLKLALLEAFFTRRENVGDIETLASIAASIGLDRDEAMKVLTDERYASAVRDEMNLWVSRGVQGVPAVIFNEKYLVSGAQGIENFVSILRQIEEEDAA